MTPEEAMRATLTRLGLKETQPRCFYCTFPCPPHDALPVPGGRAHVTCVLTAELAAIRSGREGTS